MPSMEELRKRMLLVSTPEEVERYDAIIAAQNARSNVHVPREGDLVLSPEDAEQIAYSLPNPLPPVDALKRGFQRHREMIESPESDTELNRT